MEKSIAGCPIKREEIRNRLSSFSWWMRLLCQRVAMAETLEQSDHTSVQRRIEGLAEESSLANASGDDADSEGGEAHTGGVVGRRCAAMGFCLR